MADDLRVKILGCTRELSHAGTGDCQVWWQHSLRGASTRGSGRSCWTAGTGLIPLGRELARRQAAEIVLLLSHLHHDHTQGFPFFIPAFLPNVKLHIFGPDGATESLRKVLEHNQSFETFPVSLRDMASSKNIQPVRETQVIVWDEQGIPYNGIDCRLQGGGGQLSKSIDPMLIQGESSFIGSIGAGDQSSTPPIRKATPGMDRRLVKFAQNADLLIHDAQYLEEHYQGQLLGISLHRGIWPFHCPNGL